LFRKPDQIRIIGQDPVIHTTAFDMVSSGPEFRVYLPSKKLFIIGQNDAPTTSKNKLENLRPAAFLGSMLVKPPDPATEISLLEDDTDEDHAFYVILILRKQQDQLVLERSVYFDRLTLRMIRQKSFDETGATTSDTRYSEWKTFNNVIFPTVIDINRPKDGYGVVMKVVKLEINVTITDDKFVLTQPEGTKLQVIGAKP
jgi:outer membrane lipoprotein-sorting protein